MIEPEVTAGFRDISETADHIEDESPIPWRVHTNRYHDSNAWSDAPPIIGQGIEDLEPAEYERRRDGLFFQAAWREYLDAVAYGGVEYTAEAEYRYTAHGDPSHPHEWTPSPEPGKPKRVRCDCGAVGTTRIKFEPIVRAPRVDHVLHSMPRPPKRWVRCELGQGACGCKVCESELLCRSFLATCNKQRLATLNKQTLERLGKKGPKRFTYPIPTPKRSRAPEPQLSELEMLLADIGRVTEQLEAACARASRSSKPRLPRS